ncbi:precorrin-6Y C5,15-methyltransferase (decarboxylating), CbiT subunit [Porphyromonas uenonis 60-3]|uniref:Precorrin-6Y C5,15-methyltransferase (Decarboxylating), CbiT subunit n=1 Tax=Porphyromonas uenonis 60-3 TaxID=596327 RepID=C2MDA4_9PORP|nr:bifunctional cobalt-precorrin-7 (C(5))-methyltransferase/cobalt-precorrin-6B (C(15))-methyltransferase [Porphyromonas uenonis]EEK16296.1 precorrin-6Y C5,15-methyltransferase (decarboxylating), CbiT subunit [Porphyromonas uenonis 60-3]
MKIILIGLSDDREQRWNPELLERLTGERTFSGGARHHDIVREILPSEYHWIDITPPIDDVIEQYKAYDTVVVFASCDPIFNGIGQRIMQLLPEAEIELHPYFHSLQLLAHAALQPYQDMHVVSLTGRPWQAFDAALISGERMIGILTDRKEHTPQRIAQRMLDYGYDNYRAIVGEHLGNRERQQLYRLSIAEMAERTFAYPNNLILIQTKPLPRSFGIPDADFIPLNGRERMITKRAIRLETLSQLDLHQAHVLWDIGSCTGSVSIEARLQQPSLQVVAFEIRPEGAELLDANARRHHTPGITFCGGDFLRADLDPLPQPDAVFIGGHGGHLQEIVEETWRRLALGGRIVFNSVSSESEEAFRRAIATVGGSIASTTRMQIDDYNPIAVLQATKSTH